MKAKVYALYKGENLIDTGTIYQLAKRQNVQIKTISFYQTHTYQKRNRGKRLCVFPEPKYESTLPCLRCQHELGCVDCA